MRKKSDTRRGEKYLFVTNQNSIYCITDYLSHGRQQNLSSRFRLTLQINNNTNNNTLHRTVIKNSDNVIECFEKEYHLGNRNKAKLVSIKWHLKIVFSLRFSKRFGFLKKRKLEDRGFLEPPRSASNSRAISIILS
jgi:hypothetical protein